MEEGSEFLGYSFGAKTTELAEVVFNTSLTGYQEILTDPSYKGQVVTFTHPHIGNTGINLGKLMHLTPLLSTPLIYLVLASSLFLSPPFGLSSPAVLGPFCFDHSLCLDRALMCLELISSTSVV
jgi:hypothetical protein